MTATLEETVRRVLAASETQITRRRMGRVEEFDPFVELSRRISYASRAQSDTHIRTVKTEEAAEAVAALKAFGLHVVEARNSRGSVEVKARSPQLLRYATDGLVVGSKHGRLTVLEGEAAPDSFGAKLIPVRCACGTERVARESDVRRGGVTSCGCAKENSNMTKMFRTPEQRAAWGKAQYEKRDAVASNVAKDARAALQRRRVSP